MATEIERKFLIRDESYKQYATAAHTIRQAYLCVKDGKSVRIRIIDNHAVLTIKGPSSANGVSRYEWEKEINKTEAEELLKICEAGSIHKIRHIVPAGPHCYEVDEFLDENEGLTVAEIELNAEDEAFEKPEWLGQEVTGNTLFYNNSLRTFPYSKWTANTHTEK